MERERRLPLHSSTLKPLIPLKPPFFSPPLQKVPNQFVPSIFHATNPTLIIAGCPNGDLSIGEVNNIA
jgi:hypothetical protein